MRQCVLSRITVTASAPVWYWPKLGSASDHKSMTADAASADSVPPRVIHTRRIPNKVDIAFDRVFSCAIRSSAIGLSRINAKASAQD